MACEGANQETVDTREECCGAEDSMQAEQPAEEVPAEEVPAEECECAEAACEPQCACAEAATASLVNELFGQTSECMNGLVAVTRKVHEEVRDMHRLYHNDFAGRLKDMQAELERYHEIDRGRVFDDILTEIARLYSDNVSVVESVSDASTAKRLRYMFLDMLQILETNGTHKLQTPPGEKRNTRHSKVMERIPTDDELKHDTVAASHCAGFYVENRTLVKEMVDVYIYTPKAE